MSREFGARLFHAFRRTALPLSAYYAVTLALPLANGAAWSGAAFAKHAVVVLVIPPVAIVAAVAGHAMAHAYCRAITGGRRLRSNSKGSHGTDCA